MNTTSESTAVADDNITSPEMLDEKSTAAFLAVLGRAESRGFNINRTKIAKLLYLTDLFQAENSLDRVTSINWRWHHYGPYERSIVNTEHDLVENNVIVSEPYVSSRNNKPGHTLHLVAEQPFSLPLDALCAIESIVDAFGHMSSDEIRDLSYKTTPMIRAQEGGIRGLPLDLEDTSPVRRRVVKARRTSLEPKVPVTTPEAQSGLLKMIPEDTGSFLLKTGA